MSAPEMGRQPPRQESARALEQQQKAQFILQYIERQVIGQHASADANSEKEIRDHFKTQTVREKVETLYEKLMSYQSDRKAMLKRKKNENGASDDQEVDEGSISISPDLISEIKILLEDAQVRELFGQTYAQAQMETKSYRKSEIGQDWKNLNSQIEQAEKEFKELEKKLFLKQIKGSSELSAAQTKIERLAAHLLALKERRDNLKQLKDLPHVAENTDAVAEFQFEQLVKYQEQMEKGFVWLPSRQEIHQQVLAALQNGRWPVLVGEAGTGKSDQADAAAIELTGFAPTEIQCEVTTGERQLIKDVETDGETGGSYESYGAMKQAFTGKKDSRTKSSKFKTGRIVRLDESGRLGPKAYSIIKKARQVRPGDDFYGDPMLPGASAILTTNPVGNRYPGRVAVDPAMRRELAEIPVDYVEFTAENPELYEFMLTALLDKNHNITVPKEELGPAYERKEIPEEKRQKLEDGSTVVATQELIQNTTDTKHGMLWRLAGAVKALQDSFVAGNANEKEHGNLLRFKENPNGTMDIDDTGTELTLSTSTITLGEVRSWMQGFGERLQKQDKAFQTKSFSEWIQLKLNVYLRQVDNADREKIKAIFNHFHLFDKAPDVSQAKPLTPKEIGYLSPRVPRPLEVERPPEVEKPPEEPEKVGSRENEVYEAVEVVLEAGGTVKIKKGPFSGKTLLSENLTVPPGRKFTVDGRTYVFEGMVEEGTKDQKGKFAASIADERDLHVLFNDHQVERGEIRYQISELEGDVSGLCDWEAKQTTTAKA